MSKRYTSGKLGLTSGELGLGVKNLTWSLGLQKRAKMSSKSPSRQWKHRLEQGSTEYKLFHSSKGNKTLTMFTVCRGSRVLKVRWITYRSNLAALCHAMKSAVYVLSCFLSLFACRSSASIQIGRFFSVVGPNSRSWARVRTSLKSCSAASYLPCLR